MTTRALRAWQSDCLDVCLRAVCHKRDILVAAAPGAGKTTFALTLASRLAEAGLVDHVYPVAHTRIIQRQWSDAAAAYPLVATVTTYPHVAREPMELARRPLVILDECHHAADKRTWGKGLRQSFGGGDVIRLLLSGTPFREDAFKIPFVTYDAQGVSVADYSYPYDRAIADGVCRPVGFTPISMLIRFKDKPAPEIMADVLRRSLDPAAGMVDAMIRAADAKLTETRARPGCADAGALLLAMDQDHARRCAAVVRSVTGEPAVVVVSDSPTAEQDLAAFKAGTARWLIAVKMVSEGVDVPRLMVAAYLTNTVTTLFFRQFVGRLVRTRDASANELGHVFIPDDYRLIREAAEIKAEVRKAAADGSEAPPALRTAGDLSRASAPAWRDGASRHVFTERYNAPAWAR